MADIVHLAGLLDEHGAAIQSDLLLPAAVRNPDIAPWAEVPPLKHPARSPNPSRSFSSLRHPASASPIPQRPADIRLPDMSWPPHDDHDDHFYFDDPHASPEPPKSKSFFSRLKNRSKSRVRLDSLDSSLVPPLPDYRSIASVSRMSLAPSLVTLGSAKEKKEKREIKLAKKFRAVASSPKTSKDQPPPPPDPDELTLDTNLDRMEGIVDPTYAALGVVPNFDPTSPNSAFDSSSISHHSFSDASSLRYQPTIAHSVVSSAEFSNPFVIRPGSASDMRKPSFVPPDLLKVSPKTLLPPLSNGALSSSDGHGDQSWTPPQSWAVHRDGVDKDEVDYSSDDDDGVRKPVKSKKLRSPLAPPLPGKPPGLPSKTSQALALRIYRASGNYHVVNTGPSVDVASLVPALREKLLKPTEREMYRLYLREHSRERILASHERPTVIVRQRLDQAGYEPEDIPKIITHENLNFLVKFIYKSQRLGPTEDDFHFEKTDIVDLTNRSLRTIPVKLHRAAEQIVCLVLSCNPMLEIPLDFIQTCISLRDLRLSNMSIKRVPQSVRHASSLVRLDLSANRLSNLAEAFLDNIPTLKYLNLRCNRLESLPWYFPRIHSLAHLDLANNRMKNFPHVLLSVESLTYLDVSFNDLEELPNDISRLRSLVTFKIEGNRIARLPPSMEDLRHLKYFECQRNQIVDIGVVCTLPSLTVLRAAYNSVSSLDLSLGPHLTTLDVSHNDVTQISIQSSSSPRGLTELNLSYAKLSSIDNATLGSLISLRTLYLNHNTFKSLPESLGHLCQLTKLVCSDNKLTALPESIGQLELLRELDAHNNNLIELPVSIWNCASLEALNLTSNLLGNWHDPPIVRRESDLDEDPRYSRKSSVVSLTAVPVLPPLAHSLRRLYLGENRLIDEVLHVLMIFKELRTLNLSFNDFQDVPTNFFTNLNLLEELCLSGNKIASLPTEDLPKLQHLKRLYLNGNKLQTLPHELGKVKSLTVLDVGSNQLKYNINNWEFDWNWNFNKNLKYLNLSGNKRLQIKSDAALKTAVNARHSRNSAPSLLQSLSGFTDLQQLSVLGLMDVTITTTGHIPDENDDRRVRTSSSIVNGMAYGISDALGRNDRLNFVDLAHEFRGQPGEAIFAMFGLAQQAKPLPPEVNTNRVAKYLRDHFLPGFVHQLNQLKKPRESISDALRRAFLRLNQDLYDMLVHVSNGGRKMSHVSLNSTLELPNPYMQTGAVGIVLYFVGKTLYVANLGDTLAVVSRQGSALLASRKHAPFDVLEMDRIRAADGWVSSTGKVNDDVDSSRAFGFYNHLPIINARPDISVVELTPADEFVIVANRSLWDYVSYQTAVDIARTEPDPTVASQKLRDFAMSYGADGSIMIMVIGVADLFGTDIKPESAFNIPRKVKGGILDRDIARLDGEVPAPTGHLTLVFTDIRNSTHLWEVNPGMPTAMRIHNNLLRRQLRLCGGYEVKTEGDAFMCSFPTSLAAVWWCLTVQEQLLHESWPREILECDDGREEWDTSGQLIARGLSVRMGVHCGMPVCERDPITGRMDYFGPIVNRTARISGNAQGGEVMCSADVMREVNASVLRTERETEYSRVQPLAAIEAVRRMGVYVKQVGEVKLKGLEVPELLTLIYPTCLQGRAEDKPTSPVAPLPPVLSVTPAQSASGSGSTPGPGSVPPQPAPKSKLRLNWQEIRDLGMICLRLEAMSAGRIFRSVKAGIKSEDKGKGKEKAVEVPVAEVEVEHGPPEDDAEDDKTDDDESEDEDKLHYLIADPEIVLPHVHDRSTDEQLLMALDVVAVRIENASRAIRERECGSESSTAPDLEGLDKRLQDAIARRGGLDERTLAVLLDALEMTERA